MQAERAVRKILQLLDEKERLGHRLKSCSLPIYCPKWTVAGLAAFAWELIAGFRPDGHARKLTLDFLKRDCCPEMVQMRFVLPALFLAEEQTGRSDLMWQDFGGRFYGPALCARRT
jgi:hypothetical protein